ncbi:hypothetical protein F2981_16380 [Sinorhizobium meliloti]|nr:hypothetical protein [Sinorhizobium meliloti]
MALSSSTVSGRELYGGATRSRPRLLPHNGSETTAASFRVVVEDGNEDNSAPTPATFQFHRQTPSTTLLALRSRQHLNPHYRRLPRGNGPEGCYNLVIADDAQGPSAVFERRGCGAVRNPRQRPLVEGRSTARFRDKPIPRRDHRCLTTRLSEQD